MATAATLPVGRQARRQDNRRQQLLDAAARRFCAFGYDATSMRDIAGDVGMHAGSMYYHFPSKEELLVAVHEEGIRRVSAAVETAIASEREPWRRLEAFAAAHLGVLLDGGDYAQVVIRELPREPERVRHGLVRLRDRYESLAARLVEALPLAAGVDRRALRLLLMGALNWSQTWYRPGGQTPEAAVTEGGIVLSLQDIFEVLPELPHRVGAILVDSEVTEIVPEQTPDQELHRHLDLLTPEPMAWEDPRYEALRLEAGWIPPSETFQPPPIDVHLTVTIRKGMASA